MKHKGLKVHILGNQEIYLNARQEKQYNLYMEAKGKVGLVKHSDGWRVYDPDNVRVVKKKGEHEHKWKGLFEDENRIMYTCTKNNCKESLIAPK